MRCATLRKPAPRRLLPTCPLAGADTTPRLVKIRDWRLGVLNVTLLLVRAFRALQPLYDKHGSGLA